MGDWRAYLPSHASTNLTDNAGIERPLGAGQADHSEPIRQPLSTVLLLVRQSDERAAQAAPRNLASP